VNVAPVPIFFTNTGLHTKIGSLSSATAWLGCLLVLLVAVAGKLGGCYLGARAAGQDRQNAASVAALMNTRGLMGLVAISVGRELELLNDELFTMFVIMALVTTLMTSPLLRLWLPGLPQLGREQARAQAGGQRWGAPRGRARRPRRSARGTTGATLPRSASLPRAKWSWAGESRSPPRRRAIGGISRPSLKPRPAVSGARAAVLDAAAG